MEHFNEYIFSKLCLNKMVCQFFDTNVSVYEVLDYDIDVTKEDIKDNGNIAVCFHQFKSDGLLAWNYLNIENDYITYRKMWDMQYKLKDETKLDNVDYHTEYLKICILLIDMVLKYYSSEMELEDAIRNKIEFKEMDELDGKVSVCEHLFESAGEHVWNLLSIDKPAVGVSILYDKRKKLTNELINIKDGNVKKLVKGVNYEKH